ncbi:MAG: hypothetical protein ACREOO_18390 [bacterium]
MNLNDIRSGERVLLDANILLYAIQRASGQCKRLLTRCAEDDITGILPNHVFAMVMQHLMIAEARDNGWVAGSNLGRQLRDQPDRVRALVRYESLMRDILAIGFHEEPLEREDFLTALPIQRQSGLLASEALLLALGQRLRINAVVSANSALASVQGMMLYSPDDLE